MKKLLLASTSTIYGSNYLEYILDEVESLFSKTSEVLFIPYARPSGLSYNDYTAKASSTFKKINKTVKGIHEFESLEQAITNAKGVFVGGGNTFLLLKTLQQHNLLEPLKRAILNGTPYLGTSAGSNICGLTIGTTNDMPIVMPKNFNALGIVPFNLNVHYLDPDPKSTHKGETREVRIKEFQQYNTQPVVALREGSWLELNAETIQLKGKLSARLFSPNKLPLEINANSVLNHIH